MKTRYRSALAAFASLSLLALGCLAAEPSAAKAPAGELLLEYWTVTPKPGMELQFEKALTEHAQWRRDHKDPWTWYVSAEAYGPETGTYFIRSDGHTWTELGAYDASNFSSQANENWDTTVGPYVAKIQGSILEWLPAVSHWNTNVSTRVARLQTMYLKQGMEEQFLKVLTEFKKAADEAKWPYYWGYARSVTGPTPCYTLVMAKPNFAGFEAPKPSFPDAIDGVLGKGATNKLLAEAAACVTSSNVTFAVAQPQYTVKGAK